MQRVDIQSKTTIDQDPLLRELRRSSYHLGPNFSPCKKRQRKNNSNTKNTSSHNTPATTQKLSLKAPTSEFQTNHTEQHWKEVHDADVLLIGRYPLHTLKHIRFRQKERCANIYRQALEIATGVADVTSPAATAAFKLVTFFPAMVLRKPVTGLKSSLTDRMNAFCTLQWGDIISNTLVEAEEAATTPQKSRTYKGKKGVEHVDSVGARATRLLRVGELSRAYQALVTSSPPIQPTPEYVEALRAKHPAPTHPIRLPVADLHNHSKQHQN